MFLSFFKLSVKTQTNATHYVKLGKKRRESSNRNYYIISPRVTIKAIIIINMLALFSCGSERKSLASTQRRLFIFAPSESHLNSFRKRETEQRSLETAPMNTRVAAVKSAVDFGVGGLPRKKVM